MEHLKQVCQERDLRIQQLEKELGHARLELKNTTEKYKELSERETKSVACCTEDLPTNEERFEQNGPSYGFTGVNTQGTRTVPGYVSSVEGPWLNEPYPQGAEDLGAQSNGFIPSRKYVRPEEPSRNQIGSVPGSPARRHVMSRGSVQGTSGRRSAQGYQLPPTPPSGGRGSRGRRNTAGGRYVRILFLVVESFRKEIRLCL